MRFDVTWYIVFRLFVDVDGIQSVHHTSHTLYLYCTRTRHVQKQVVKQNACSFKQVYWYVRGLFHCCAASQTQDSHKTGARIILKSTSSQQHNVTCM